MLRVATVPHRQIMVGESNQNVFLIQIAASSFAEFEISEFEISSFDCYLSVIINHGQVLKINQIILNHFITLFSMDQQSSLGYYQYYLLFQQHKCMASNTSENRTQITHIIGFLTAGCFMPHDSISEHDCGCLILSPPNLKMSFGTTFTFSIIIVFRKQIIKQIRHICKPMRIW